MAKYKYEGQYVKDKDAELIIATYAIANELAELNSFLRKDEAEKTEELLDAIRRESGVDV